MMETGNMTESAVSMVRGIRGATTVCEDSAEAIHSATRELLLAILEANPDLRPTEIASVFFTVTHEISAAYPALAAREMGWDEVPLMCASGNRHPRACRCHW